MYYFILLLNIFQFLFSNIIFIIIFKCAMHMSNVIRRCCHARICDMARASAMRAFSRERWSERFLRRRHERAMPPASDKILFWCPALTTPRHTPLFAVTDADAVDDGDAREVGAASAPLPVDAAPFSPGAASSSADAKDDFPLYFLRAPFHSDKPPPRIFSPKDMKVIARHHGCHAKMLLAAGVTIFIIFTLRDNDAGYARQVFVFAIIIIILIERAPDIIARYTLLLMLIDAMPRR